MLISENICEWWLGLCRYAYIVRSSSPWMKVPGQFRSRERKFKGERARERIGQGPIGRFTPGSDLAWERKGCEPHVNIELYCYTCFSSCRGATSQYGAVSSATTSVRQIRTCFILHGCWLVVACVSVCSCVFCLLWGDTQICVWVRAVKLDFFL